MEEYKYERVENFSYFDNESDIDLDSDNHSDYEE